VILVHDSSTLLWEALNDYHKQKNQQIKIAQEQKQAERASRSMMDGGTELSSQSSSPSDASDYKSTKSKKPTTDKQRAGTHSGTILQHSCMAQSHTTHYPIHVSNILMCINRWFQE